MTSAEAKAKALIPPFLAFAKTLDGDEKSEAQIFLDHFFRALGHEGAKQAGATFEYRVAKKPGTSQLSLFSGDELASAPKLKGGVKFADLLWPGRVLFEMKSRGGKLETRYDQLLYYCSSSCASAMPASRRPRPRRCDASQSLARCKEAGDQHRTDQHRRRDD